MDVDLDHVDRKILKELQRNGRASFRDISSRIKVSTPTVSSRVQAMTDNGLIRGYSVDLDAEMLGQISVILTVDAKPSDLAKVVESIQDEEIVRAIYVLSDSRVLCILSFYSQLRYQQFIESLATIPEILRTDTSMVVRTPKERARASLTDDAGLMIRCYYCGKLMKDEGVKIKLDGKYHYLCCGVCAKLYKEKYEKMKNASGL